MLQFFSASTCVVDPKRAIAECLENALDGEKILNICKLEVKIEAGSQKTEVGRH
jgi:hypothetical protein